MIRKLSVVKADILVKKYIYILKCLEILLFGGIVRFNEIPPSLNYLYTLYVDNLNQFKKLLVKQQKKIVSRAYYITLDGALVKRDFFESLGMKEIDLSEEMSLLQTKIIMQAFMFILRSINSERKKFKNIGNQLGVKYFRKQFHSSYENYEKKLKDIRRKQNKRRYDYFATKGYF